MCGLSGIIDPKNLVIDPRGTVQRMTDAIKHRGPDDSGIWISARAQVAMGFRRLSIQDLSQHGHQPMASETGRWRICFNGEIYNFASLRGELTSLGHRFRGGSDTEVILAAIEEWGVTPAIGKMAGMFAIALWDDKEEEFWLVRDRFGVKPLYFGCPGSEQAMGQGDGHGRIDGTFYFGSELKSLRAAWASAPGINPYALRLLLRYQYIPAPWTPWSGIRKLLPGHYFKYQMSTGQTRIVPYWSAGKVLAEGSENPIRESAEVVAAQLEAEVDRAVRERIVADVPLGAFLSGGIDSAMVVASMQRVSKARVKTFTIGSDDKSIDESHEAARIAKHLGTDHSLLRVGLEEARGPILQLGDLSDEPLGDASFIPTYLVSQFARKQVTVILSGDGGDEVFAGYPQHRYAAKMWPLQRRIPNWLASALRSATLNSSMTGLRPPLGRLLQLLPGYSSRHAQQRVVKALRVMGTKGRPEFMGKWRNLVPRPEQFLTTSGGEEPTLLTPDFDVDGLGPSRAECWADTVSYLPNDILLKVDRASMAVSLEAREPLLDHRLFEFASRIPDAMLIRGGRGKWILREALYRSVPQHLVDGPKRGFALPIAGWVVGPLRDWAEALLSESRIRSEGHFDPQALRRAWDSYVLPGAQPPTLPFFGLWSILAFQAWFERWN